jgi:xanthine dehydrogenase accessory factor
MQGFEALNLIEHQARNCDEFAVVRIIDGAAAEILVADRNGQLQPSFQDRALAHEISERVRSLVSARGAATVWTTKRADERSIRIVVEVVRPKSELVIFGAGHVGQALAMMGAIAGYEVTVIDDRREFACRERLPDHRIKILVSDYGAAVSKLGVSAGTAIAIVTRGHQYDELCLRSVLDLPASYIGMIGSKRRVISVFEKLIQAGASREALSRVHAPIGLRIGAKSPQEIAVAILAEIISQNNPGAKE